MSIRSGDYRPKVISQIELGLPKQTLTDTRSFTTKELDHNSLLRIFQTWEQKKTIVESLQAYSPSLEQPKRQLRSQAESRLLTLGKSIIKSQDPEYASMKPPKQPSNRSVLPGYGREFQSVDERKPEVTSGSRNSQKFRSRQQINSRVGRMLADSYQSRKQRLDLLNQELNEMQLKERQLQAELGRIESEYGGEFKWICERLHLPLTCNDPADKLTLGELQELTYRVESVRRKAERALQAQLRLRKQVQVYDQNGVMKPLQQRKAEAKRARVEPAGSRQGGRESKEGRFRKDISELLFD